MYSSAHVVVQPLPTRIRQLAGKQTCFLCSSTLPGQVVNLATVVSQQGSSRHVHAASASPAEDALLAVGTSCVSLLYTCVAGDAVHAGVPADVAL